MSTCRHWNTTFSRDICLEPCGNMHSTCDDCYALLDDCEHDPANWTTEQAQTAQAELDELERTDPAAAAAAASYDRMVERMTGRAIHVNEIDPSSAQRAAEQLIAQTQASVVAWTDAGWPERAAREIDGTVKRLIEEALATQRAEIHARYEAVADQLSLRATLPARTEHGHGYRDATADAARRIRQVRAS